MFFVVEKACEAGDGVLLQAVGRFGLRVQKVSPRFEQRHTQKVQKTDL